MTALWVNFSAIFLFAERSKDGIGSCIGERFYSTITEHELAHTRMPTAEAVVSACTDLWEHWASNRPVPPGRVWHFPVLEIVKTPAFSEKRHFPLTKIPCFSVPNC